MALSTDTLIHFTDSKENLKSILQENFRIFMCNERLVLNRRSPSVPHQGMLDIHVPMVSFCDIPLSEIKDHMSKYGSYGLGMTKVWGARKGLNPVLYLEQGSNLIKSFKLAFTRLTHGTHESKPSQTDAQRAINAEAQKALTDVMRYLKNYESYLYRDGELTLKYRFSDEREWRYVPPYTANCEMLLGDPDFHKPDIRSAAEAKLVDFRLEFEPNDIKYIIINDDSEISEFIEHLRSVKSKKYSPDEIDRLTTRILTSEQINSDM